MGMGKRGDHRRNEGNRAANRTPGKLIFLVYCPVFSIRLQWTVGEKRSVLELAHPHPGGNPTYFQLMKDNWYLGQAVKNIDGWHVDTQGKSDLSADEITILEDLLNSSNMEPIKLTYKGQEIIVNKLQGAGYTNYHVKFPGKEIILVPFEVNGKQEWGYQHDGVSPESIALGKFLDENAYEIKVSIPGIQSAGEYFD
jgi:hypothetical protein